MSVAITCLSDLTGLPVRAHQTFTERSPATKISYRLLEYRAQVIGASSEYSCKNGLLY
jgi:hypothetical protein